MGKKLTLYKIISLWSLVDFPDYCKSEEYYSSDEEALTKTSNWIHRLRPESQAKKNRGHYPGYDYEYPISARVYKRKPLFLGRFFPIWRKIGEV